MEGEFDFNSFMIICQSKGKNETDENRLSTYTDTFTLTSAPIFSFAICKQCLGKVEEARLASLRGRTDIE